MFGWGKKKSDPSPRPGAKGAGIDWAAVRRTHQEYWTANSGELQALQREPASSLPLSRKFRLLHLATMELLGLPILRGAVESGDDDLDEAAEKTTLSSPVAKQCLSLVNELAGPTGPCKARAVAVWQGPKPPDEQQPPTRVGPLTNASFTHQGALEIMRLLPQDKFGPVEFIPFAEMHSAIMVSSSLYRLGLVFLEGGERIEAIVPMLYGLSWWSKNTYDQDGSMTRFVAPLPTDSPGPALQVGLGHQDFQQTAQGGMALFGLGSVARLEIALDIREPDFDDRCRKRGMDPAAVRAQYG